MATRHGVEIPIELSMDGVSVEGKSLNDIQKEASKMGKLFSKALERAASAGLDSEKVLAPLEKAMSEYRQAFKEFEAQADKATALAGKGTERDQFRNLQKVMNAYSNLESKQRQLTAAAEETERSVGKVKDQLNASSTAVSNMTKTLKGVWATNNFAETVSKIYDELLAADVPAKELSKNILDMGDAIDKLDVNKLHQLFGDAILRSPTLRNITNNFAGLANNTKKADNAANTHKKTLWDLIKAYKKLHKTGYSSTGSLEKSFNKLKKNMLQFVLGFRSMYFLVRRLRKTFIDSMSEMTKYVPSLNKQVSALSMAFNGLKGSLGTAFQPVASFIIPTIITLTNALTQCMYAIGKFFATLTGQGVIYKATANQLDYARSLDKTSGSAKKADKALAKFDTLNILGSKDADGGGGASGADFTFDPEELNPEDAVSEFAKKFKEAWEKSDFTEVGVIVGTKLNETLKNIKWPSVKQVAYNLGKDFATFLNGALSIDLPYTLGVTIGEAFNTAINLVAGFVLEANWTEIASAIGQGIVGFIETIDWGLLAQTLFDLLCGLILTAFTGLTAFIVTSLAELLMPVATWVSEKLTEFFEVTIPTIWDNFITWITNKWTEFKTNTETAWEEFKTNLLDWLKANKENIAKKLAEIKQNLHDRLEEMKTNVRDKFDNIKQTIQDKLETAKNTVAEKFATIKQSATELVTGMVTKISNKFDEIKNKIKTVMSDVKTNISSVMTLIKENMKSKLNTIIGFVNSFVKAIAAGINTVIDGLNTIQVTVPDWSPLLPGKHFGINLGHVSAPQIPELARGAVIPPNAPFMAMLGDQKHGTNIETPLSTMVEAFKQAQSSQPVNVNIHFDGNLAQLARILKPVIDKENNRVGTTLIRGGNRI